MNFNLISDCVPFDRLTIPTIVHWTSTEFKIIYQLVSTTCALLGKSGSTGSATDSYRILRKDKCGEKMRCDEQFVNRSVLVSCNTEVLTGHLHT